MFYDIIVIALTVLVDALFNILVKVNHLVLLFTTETAMCLVSPIPYLH